MWLEEHIIPLCTLISALTGAVVAIINALKSKEAFRRQEWKMDDNTRLTRRAEQQAAAAVVVSQAAADRISAKTDELKDALAKCTEVHADLAQNVRSIINGGSK